MIGVDIIACLEKGMAGKPLHHSVTGDNRIVVAVDAGDIKAAVGALLECKPRFVTLVAIDNGLDIELRYHFSVDSKLVILSTAVPKETSQMETITDVAPAAEFIEKEVSELFGLSFTGHPRDANLVLTDDWAARKPLAKRIEGSLPVPARFEVQNLLASGSAIGVLKLATDKREKAGLPSLPIAGASAENLKEYQELIKRTGFGKRAGYDWEKGKLRYR